MNKNRISSQIMELKDLIAGPLVATIDADAMSTGHYLDYLFKLAFESYDPLTSKTGELRMLTFNYKAVDINGSRNQTISIPLLSLIPLPLLQIKEADFDFEIKVLDASTAIQNQNELVESSNNSAIPKPKDSSLRVILSPNNQINNTRNLSSNMKVRVKMRQADIPAGLSLLLAKASNDMVSDTSNEDGN